MDIIVHATGGGAGIGQCSNDEGEQQ